MNAKKIRNDNRVQHSKERFVPAFETIFFGDFYNSSLQLVLPVAVKTSRTFIFEEGVARNLRIRWK